MSENEKSVAQDYKEIWELAQKLTDKEYEHTSLGNVAKYQERRDNHVIGMITMYEARFGTNTYEAAWKALQDALIASNNSAAIATMKLIEADFEVGATGELIKNIAKPIDG